jgi:hypothetical protein
MNTSTVSRWFWVALLIIACEATSASAATEQCRADAADDPAMAAEACEKTMMIYRLGPKDSIDVQTQDKRLTVYASDTFIDTITKRKDDTEGWLITLGELVRRHRPPSEVPIVSVCTKVSASESILVVQFSPSHRGSDPMWPEAKKLCHP